MIKKRTSPWIIVYYVLTCFLIWIILFEFLLPVNKFLPKPSIVIQSFAALWKDYHLLLNLISSIASIYISVIASFYLLKLLNRIDLLDNKEVKNFIESIEWLLKYIPGIALGFFLIYWFPESEYAKYLFIFAVIFNSMFLVYFSLAGKVDRSYIDSAISLGAGKGLIADKIIWKSIEPDLIDHIYNAHVYFWTMIIIFEYAKYGYGLGTIFRRALEFKDLSALFAVVLVTGLIIFLGAVIIHSIKKKFFFWRRIEH